MPTAAATPPQEREPALEAVGIRRGGWAWRLLEPRDLALWSAAGASLLVWLWLMVWYWRGGLPYDATSGVWTALADDVAHGTLYRPVHSSLGYGGTRYMPLFFVLHGLLMRAGAPAVAAGLTLTIAGLVLFLSGLYGALRRMGVARQRAAATALLLPGCISVQLLTLATRGDLLAAGLLLWGLSALLSRRLGAAALFWTLAVATKLMAIWAPIAAACWLLLRAARSGDAVASDRAERRRAGRLLALTGAGVAGVLLATLVASNGRVLAAFAAAADGGATWRYALAAPWWLLYAARQDPFFLGLAAAAAVMAGRRIRRVGWDLPLVWAAGATLSTLLIFASPGADSNHLLDVLAAALVLLALEAPAREAAWIAGVFAMAQLASQLPDAPATRHYLQEHGRPTVQRVERFRRRLVLAGRGGPVLSENPLLPILWGERPEVADAFALRLLARRDARIGAELEGKLREHRYRGVLLVDWAGELTPALERGIRADEPADRGRLDFPGHFLPAVSRHYRVTLRLPPYILLEPRP